MTEQTACARPRSAHISAWNTDAFADATAYSSACPIRSFSREAQMTTSVTAAAWGWVDEMDLPDASRVVACYREHADRGPEDAF